MNNQMVVFNAKKLKDDCIKVYKENYTKVYTSFTLMLECNGLNSSTFSNAFRNYVRNDRTKNKEIIDKQYVTDGIEDSVGALANRVYDVILQVFDLNDIYRIPKRRTQELQPPKSAEKVEKSTEVSNNDIMAELKHLNKSLDDIAMALLLIADITAENAKRPKKPIAKLDKE